MLSKLRTAQVGRSLLVLEVCSSTNDVAAKKAEDGSPNGFVVVANEQTSGRGRNSRRWLSPKGGIWMTVLIRPPVGRETLSGLTQLGALSIVRILTQDLGISASVRWPNDIVTRRGKLAGVLAEARTAGDEVLFALLGLGINANFHSAKLGELNCPVSTLLEELGSPINRATLIASILTELEHLLNQMQAQRTDQVLHLLRESSTPVGRRVLVELEGRQRIEGTINGYDTLTRIRVLSSDGTIAKIEAGSVISIAYPD